MSRVRLTARDSASADQTPYPGNVNQERKDPKWEQYHTFEQKVNHELPDMRHEWQDDSRDDIGFGIPEAWGKSPKVASVKVAANKAVRIAVLLLGEKVDDEVIEAQASDFMAMDQAAMDSTLNRFASTQKLYAADEEKKDEEKVEEEKTSAKKDDEKKSADETEKKDEKVEEEKTSAKKEDDKDAKCSADEDKKLEEKVASIVASALKAALPQFLKDKNDKKDKKSADESDKKDEKVEDEKTSADETDKKDEKVEDEKTSADETDKKDEEKDEEKQASAVVRAGEMDIELQSSMDDELAPDEGADERLSSLFDGDGIVAGLRAVEGNSGRKAEASQKAGIKKLGGQPRVASATGTGGDISSIWATAPDVSEAFR